MTPNETQAVKIARMEERMKNVEGQLTDFRKEVLTRLDQLTNLMQSDSNVYATQAQLAEVKRLVAKARFMDGLMVSSITATVTFLLIYFLQNLGK